MTVAYSVRLGDWYTSLGTQKTLFNFFAVVFQDDFDKKYVEVAINDFTMHLIFSKWLRRQKCRQKSFSEEFFSMRQREVEAKKETVYWSISIHLNT